MAASKYRGRFAPSPTGPLHFGSLVAALASYLDAAEHDGGWLVRMEDVDEPRCVEGADLDILRTLERFGFHWDGPVAYQSRRTHLYNAALLRLREAGLAYPCTCSRREAGDGVYPGTCRNRAPAPGKQVAWRVRTEDALVSFEDRRAGHWEQNLAREVGDFVILRADGLFAYQLAVVVDDAEQGITDVVRGADLLDSTPRQIWLQRLLGYPEPRYMHIPLVTNEAGEKLSKQTKAPPLREENTREDRIAALRFLGYDLNVAGRAIARRSRRFGAGPNALVST
ncbi:MAG: tRNA glutamyl-Q(34) synthetase GluQRS [Acidobacteriota bacterium]|nr:tRNA glutamyl-Q(34) synthetase GluQRS [Acidobacteriota bacterium]